MQTKDIIKKNQKNSKNQNYLKKLASLKGLSPIKGLAAFLKLRPLDLFLIALGNFTIAFALVNIHIPARITEGGVLGLVLLFNKLFNWDPPMVSFLVDMILYGLGIFVLGGGFLKKAVFSSVLYSFFYKILLKIGPILPSLYDHPLIAAILGGLLLGSGCGLIVTRGGASGGDDCYAMVVQKLSGLSLSKSYLSSDISVLLASFLVYLPFSNVVWSLLTTIVSSFVIGQFEVYLPLPKKLSPAPVPNLIAE